jgi:hypothetical protein
VGGLKVGSPTVSGQKLQTHGVALNFIFFPHMLHVIPRTFFFQLKKRKIPEKG